MIPNSELKNKVNDKNSYLISRLDKCKKVAKARGWECLMDKYTNNKEYVDWKCGKGHIFSARVDIVLRGGNECPFCLKEKKLKECRDFANSHKVKLLSTEYINNKTKMIWQCEYGHKFERGFANFKKSQVCPVCNSPPDLKKCKKLAESKGGKCLSKEYVNNKEKLIWQCSEGHIFNMSYSSVKTLGHWCPECAYVKRRISIDFYKKLAESKGGECLSTECKSKEDLLEWQCGKGHPSWKATGGNVNNNGSWCPICSSSNTSIEKKFEEFLKMNKIKYIKNYRNKLELDFYLVDYKIGVECNGVYYHSSRLRKRNYHKAKQKYFEGLGIQTIFLWEDEINTKFDIIKSLILAKLKKSSEKIFARKCELKEVPYNISKTFLENNHLQGNAISSIRYGLYYSNDLVALMTFGKIRNTIGNKKYDYELIRFCNKLNTTVVGGASKLFSKFTKNYVGLILSYSANDYSNGGLYKKLGFEFSHETQPNYFYRTTTSKYHRAKFQKHKLKKLFPEYYDDKLSESQIMEKTSYHRCFNSGNKVWLFRNI